MGYLGLSAKNDIARLNMDRKGWTYPDWHAHYIQRDTDSEDEDTTYENYPLLTEFMKQHKFPFNISLRIIKLNQIKIISYQNKQDWNLVAKYNIGKRISDG